jgi:hypothetical protein
VPLLLLLCPPFFPIILFGIHHLDNRDAQHLLAQAMASDFSVTCRKEYALFCCSGYRIKLVFAVLEIPPPAHRTRLESQ